MGDDMGMDIQLSNKIYNSLKQHSNVEEKRGQRLYEKKDQSTAVSCLKIAICFLRGFEILGY